jgi:hypothetical protein
MGHSGNQFMTIPGKGPGYVAVGGKTRHEIFLVDNLIRISQTLRVLFVTGFTL